MKESYLKYKHACVCMNLHNNLTTRCPKTVVGKSYARPPPPNMFEVARFPVCIGLIHSGMTLIFQFQYLL